MLFKRINSSSGFTKNVKIWLISEMMSSSLKQLSRCLVDAVFIHSGTAVQRKKIARSIKINAKQLIACEWDAFCIQRVLAAVYVQFPRQMFIIYIWISYIYIKDLHCGVRWSDILYQVSGLVVVGVKGVSGFQRL